MPPGLPKGLVHYPHEADIDLSFKSSCDGVHAACVRVPKFAAGYNSPGMLAVARACEPRGIKRKSPKEILKFIQPCNARMLDYPWALQNPEAQTAMPEHISRQENLQRKRATATFAPLPLTVWGTAVHGMSGTWAFDSHGGHATDYVYQVPQGEGLPSDYYLCDSRERPTHCALLGGNMRNACAEGWSPQGCGFCEDHGDKLVCQVRGWNHASSKWARVPIYPSDLLGTLYPGEWKATAARPLWASVALTKRGLADAKFLPDYLVGDGPGQQLLDPESLAAKIVGEMNEVAQVMERPVQKCSAKMAGADQVGSNVGAKMAPEMRGALPVAVMLPPPRRLPSCRAPLGHRPRAPRRAPPRSGLMCLRAFL